MSVMKLYIASIFYHNGDNTYRDHALVSAPNSETAMTKLIFHMKNHHSAYKICSKTFTLDPFSKIGYVSTDGEITIKLHSVNMNNHDVVFLSSKPKKGDKK